MGVAATPMDLPEGSQHLLGAVNFLDRDLAVVRRDRRTPALAAALGAGGVRALELATDDEVRLRLSMNFVTLGPRRVVLPSGCPRTRRNLEDAGVACDEVEATECVKAAGGIACLTGIVRRG
jgi:N-dimethylarginine dimethylaminohydrolase